MNQEIRLETRSGELIEMIDLPGEGNEPDAIVRGESVFIRRPMLQTQPPKKNSPETYFEANAHHVAAKVATMPKSTFDQVTESKAVRITEDRED